MWRETIRMERGEEENDGIEEVNVIIWGGGGAETAVSPTFNAECGKRDFGEGEGRREWRTVPATAYQQ